MTVNIIYMPYVLQKTGTLWLHEIIIIDQFWRGSKCFN